MKKQLLLLAMILLPLVASSQTYVGNWPSNDIYSIPRDMSDKQHTYLCSSNYHDGFVTIEITDENLEKVKEFDINNSLYKYRVLQEELPVTLIVNNATLTPIGEADTWEDAKTFIASVDNGELVDRTEDSPYKGLEYNWIYPYQLWPAPSRYYDFYTYNGGGGTRVTKRAAADYEGLFPRFIFDWSPETKEVRRVELYYREGFQGEWKVVADYEGTSGDIVQTRFVDYDNNPGAEQKFFVTQTLFNDDSDFEVIYPIFDEGDINIEEMDRDGDGRVDQRLTQKGVKLIGYSALSESGATLCSFIPPSGFSVGGINKIIKMNECFYVIMGIWNDEGSYKGIFKVDRTTNAVQYVKSVKMNVSPTIANRSDNITVTLGADSDAKEIRVINAQGQTIKTIPVTEGQKTVTFSAQGMSQGVNIINAPEKGENNTQKIMVK